MTKLKERDIVNKIIESWNKFFPDLKFYKKEFVLRNFRVDIAAGFDINLKEIHGEEYNKKAHAPVFFEVKYNSEMRDLIFELEKQISFRDWYTNVSKCLAMVCVISDKFDKDMVKYMEKNNVHMFKIYIENDDIDTLEIKEYIPNTIEPKNIIE